jgi:hypothetical protein
MNMKKTIAAVAACAVAVSAMATSVSAMDLSYDLVKSHTVDVKTGGTLTLTAVNKTAETLTNTSYLHIRIEAPSTVDLEDVVVTIDGRNVDENRNFSLNLSGDINSYYYSKFVTTNTSGEVILDIPVTNGTTATGIPVSSSAVAATGAGVEFTVTVTAPTTLTTVAAANTALNNTLAVTYTVDTTSSNTTPGAALATAINAQLKDFKAPSSESVTYYEPFKSNTNYTNSASDVISWIQAVGYNNVIPAVNDTLYNSEDVTFTFTSYAGKVFTSTGDDNGNDFGGALTDAGKQLLANQVAASSTTNLKDYAVENLAESWITSGTTDYTSFGQHLYNEYGTEEANKYVQYYYYNGGLVNLFSGALIVNEGLTMSLTDTNVFEYGANTLSFSWEDISEGSNVNAVATYLQTLKLATSVDWYWSNLTIKPVSSDAEDVSSAAGDEAEEDNIGDGDELEEEGGDTIEDNEGEGDGEDVDNNEETKEEETTTAAANTDADNTASNPSTGNAPIALAVIPVALAAAAVVAKKAK